MTRTRNKKPKPIIQEGVTRGGPVSGERFIVKPNQRFHFVPTPNCPYYAGAYYTLTNQSYPTGEQVAVFSHNMERGKTCQRA